MGMVARSVLVSWIGDPRHSTFRRMQQSGINSYQIILFPRYIVEYSEPHDLDDGILSLDESARKCAVMKGKIEVLFLKLLR